MTGDERLEGEPRNSLGRMMIRLGAGSVSRTMTARADFETAMDDLAAAAGGKKLVKKVLGYVAEACAYAEGWTDARPESLPEEVGDDCDNYIRDFGWAYGARTARVLNGQTRGWPTLAEAWSSWREHGAVVAP